MVISGPWPLEPASDAIVSGGSVGLPYDAASLGPLAAGRVKAAMSLIEHEWMVAQSSSDKRMIVEIGTTSMRTIR